MRRTILDFRSPDSNGYIPQMNMIGRRYRHTSGREYIVGGFSWNADTDRWMVGYKAADSDVVFMRSPDKFNERFSPVQ